MLPKLDPFFEDGNEKFVTEADWNNINEILKENSELLMITLKYLMKK